MEENVSLVREKVKKTTVTFLLKMIFIKFTIHSQEHPKELRGMTVYGGSVIKVYFKDCKRFQIE